MLYYTLLTITSLFLFYWAYNVIYQLYFSPMHNIPGPMIYILIPNIYKIHILMGGFHLHMLDLHTKYGKAVRLSSNVVSFASETASKDIYSTYNFQKHGFYSAFQIVGEASFSTRDKDFHRKRKKILSVGFSERNILNLEYLVKNTCEQLKNKMRHFAERKEAFKLCLYFHCFSFDVIGEVVYGKPFNMIKNGHHPIIDWIHDLLFLSIVLFLFPFLKHFKYDSIKQLYNFSYDAIKNSKKHADRNTILNNLIDAVDPETGAKLSRKELADESIIQLAAGTDTGSNALIWIFYNLMKNPAIYRKLKQELITVFPDKNSIAYTKLKNECAYLSAVLHEGLRFMPVVSGNPMRITPKGGKVIDGYFIEEETIVGVNLNALHNLSTLWEEPDKFNPERWITGDGKFRSDPNFMPFLIGPRGCVGRTLAWMELYLATANLVRNFDFYLNDPKLTLKSKFYVVTSPTKPMEVIVKENDKLL
ncbi:cytochrome P450 [Neoconidiobolus thromboides FSU 785]|nr:cytochrome P450 [Neoconidiobolus thromboides FSU 785]